MSIGDMEMGPSSEIRNEETSDTVYEEYGNVYDEYGAISVGQVNVDVGENEDRNEIDYQEYRFSDSGSNVTKMKSKKIWLLVILAIAIAGLVVGLSVHFKEPPLPSTTTAPTDPIIIKSPATHTLSTAPVFDFSGMRFPVLLDSKAFAPRYGSSCHTPAG